VGGSVGSSGTSGAVYKTVDGGESWTKAHATPQITMETLYAMDFVDENIGFVGGGYHGTSLFKTTDGGVTWRSITVASLGQIQFLNAQVGYARNIGNYYNRIYKTVNGGETWNIVFEIDDDIKAFHFVSASTGYFVGDSGMMYKTTNGGTTWQKLTIPYEYYVNVRFFSERLGYIVGEEGQLLKTTDGGQTWQNINIDWGHTAIDIHNRDIFVGGTSGSILRSKILTDDLIDLGVSLITVTESSASVRLSIKSHWNVDNIPAYLEIETENGSYKETFLVAQVNGVSDQTQTFQFDELEPGTRYFCRVRLTEDGQRVSSPTLSFTTKEIVTSAEDVVERTLTIYPNPASQSIIITSDSQPVLSYELLDINGRRLVSTASPDSSPIDVSALPPGVYLIIVQRSDRRFVRRFVKK
jgi:photosystem II stability/assembly factor-like uncharacterized protein